MWLAVSVSEKKKKDLSSLIFTEWPQMIILRLCSLSVVITRPQAVGFNSNFHGLFDHTGSSIDYFIFGSPVHIMVSFMVLLIPAYISVWLGH